MRYRGLGFLAIILALSSAVTAVTPRFWENFSQDELLKGTLTNISLSSDGRLFLAPAYDKFFDTTQPYIFSMVRDKAGNVYLGTGHEGRVYRVDAKGNGSVYFQSKELDVFALALDASGTLYAATSPDGKIYKVTKQNEATEFCDPEDKYIWSMLFDDAGNLYAGTGGKGIVLKIDKSGKKSVFFDSDDSHIVSLSRDANGNVLAGTSPGGMVMQISPQGKAFTLLDTPLEEIRAMAVDRFGTIFAVASSAKGTSAGADKPDLSSVTAGSPIPLVTIQALSQLSSKDKNSKESVTAPGGEKDSSGSMSTIFAISREGNVETVYTSKDQMVYDIVTRDDGSILASTGPKGRLLSIDVAKQVTILTDSPEEQMTRMVAAGDFVLVAGSNQGKVYRLQTQRAETGTFVSKPLDGKTVASWGRASWRLAGSGGTTVEIATRSGNTEKPDNTWSEWAVVASPGQPVANPKARYLQWRCTFKRGSGAPAAADALERLQIAYLQQNMRPQVTSITLLPYGVGLQKTPSLQAGTLNITTASEGSMPLNAPRERGVERQPLAPRQVLQSGAQAFTWKASDDNDDNLSYAIYFKGEGNSDWKLLQKDVTDAFYTLDGGSLPDGTYTVKVVASDMPSNPYNRFLIGELASKPFVITSATPIVEVGSHKVAGKKVEVQFRARIPVGRILTGEVSVDGGEWLLVFPVDGIADSGQEDFQAITPELASGEHIIGVRATDANGNTGTAKLVLRIP